MSSENLIHVKLEYDEAVQSKKDVLLTEIDLIKMAQAVRKYKEFRLKELDMKYELMERLKSLHITMRRARAYLPKLQIPKIIKHYEEKRINEEKQFEKIEEKILERPAKIKPKPVHKEEPVPKDDLESQLREIQSRLSKLGQF
jgi:hypothetical protein